MRGLLLLILPGLLAVSLRPAEGAKRANVILIVSDDLGYGSRCLR